MILDFPQFSGYKLSILRSKIKICFTIWCLTWATAAKAGGRLVGRLGRAFASAERAALDATAKSVRSMASYPLRKLKYRSLLLRHARHTAIRNMVDAGIPRQRAKAITGHVRDAVFNRYDIG
jgi:hypothetical protein